MIFKVISLQCVITYIHVCAFACAHTHRGLDKMGRETRGRASQTLGVFYTKFKVDYMYALFSHYAVYGHDPLNDLCSPNA